MTKLPAKKRAGAKNNPARHAKPIKSGLTKTIELLERAIEARRGNEPAAEEVISITAMVPSPRAGGDPSVAVIWKRLRAIFGSRVLGDTEIEPLLHRANITIRALPNHINQAAGFREEGLHLVYADIASAVYLADIGVAIAKWYSSH
jgi:hypothetical protein